jgi:predicted 3-demethylubiquinone-9 3-methyltransferase (glyoxalase superfamily)
MVDCDNQAEVDHFWNSLTADGGQESQCGWLKDKYGLSWQIVPNALLRYVTDKDPAKAGRAMAAMMTMRKIDIAAIERAHAG